MKTIIYLSNLNVIGGCEQWIYEIAKKYSEDYDIELYYKTGNDLQLNRLKKLIRCVKHTGQEINCDNLITAYNYEIYNKSNAKENILTIHANYEYEKLHTQIHPKVTKVYAVSETAKKGFENTHKDQLDKLGLKVEVLYNPYTPEPYKRVLTLVAATRLSWQKGADAIELIRDTLIKKGYPFILLVFTDDWGAIKNKSNIILMKPTLDIEPYMKMADYVLNPSLSEGFSYTIVQSLNLGTPIICRDILIKDEIGIKDGTNSYVLNMDLSNIEEVVDKMYQNNLKGFNYQVKESDSVYKQIFKEKTKSNYKEELKMRFKVEALPIWKERNITCTDLNNKIPKLGEQWEVDKERLDVLLGDNPHNQPFVKLVEDITTVEQKVDNIIVETNDTKVVIEKKEDKPKKTITKKQPKKVK